MKEQLKRPYLGNMESNGNKLYAQFESRVDGFVKHKLSNYIPCSYNKTKVIHDPVWGTCLFYQWELEILDAPLLQRLRNISQLGLTMLTYPTAHHTRLEHSLGVVSVVTKMVDHINQESINSTQSISNEDYYKLRLAALLHDVGHCFCSHLSESIYGENKVFTELIQSFEIFCTAKPHEVFAYIIVNSPAFKDFIHKHVHLWNATIDLDRLFEDIGCMIVGAPLQPETLPDGTVERKHYLTQMINGQYDADKLDYLRRDSYTAGLALTYDIDRFLYKIKIAAKDEVIEGKSVRGRHLVIPISGVSAVEEMAFSQLMLASYIYQHQKVLATDALINDVVQSLMSNGKLQHPCDFLYYCDNDILGISSDNPDEDFKMSISAGNFNAASGKTIADIVQRINHRNLPKRAFIVNYATVKASEELKNYAVSDLGDRLRGIVELRKEIYDKAIEISNVLPAKRFGGKKPFDMYDIYISIPKTSIAKDLSNALVVKPPNNKFVSLSDIVRLSDWADAFAWHKWNAYVFSQSDILHIVGVAARVVFERHGLTFDDDTVFSSLREFELTKQTYEWLKANQPALLV